jgi:hypothetical protein
MMLLEIQFDMQRQAVLCYKSDEQLCSQESRTNGFVSPGLQRQISKVNELNCVFEASIGPSSKIMQEKSPMIISISPVFGNDRKQVGTEP